MKEMFQDVLEELSNAFPEGLKRAVIRRALLRFVQMEDMEEVGKKRVHWCQAAAIAFCNVVSLGACVTDAGLNPGLLAE
jgi:hypothetical protein